MKLSTAQSKGELDRAREACTLLADLLRDIITGVRAEEIFECAPGHKRESQDNPIRIGLNRMRMFHLLLTLSKCAEFYDHFSNCIPADCRGDFKATRNEIGRRGIVVFRNTYIGHIWDNKKNRPLTDEEASAAIAGIQNNDERSFLSWVHTPGHFEFPTTVASVVLRAATRIAKVNRLAVNVTIDTRVTPSVPIDA